MKFDAVVLAGSDPEAWLAEEGVDNKSLLLIDGKPMVQYVLEALAASAYHANTILVGSFPLTGDLAGLVQIQVPAGDTMEENIRRGVAKTTADLVTVLGSDLPFITTQDLDRVMETVERIPASLYLPVIRKEDIEARFPGSKRTYAHLTEGSVKAGNMLFFRREDWPLVEQFMADVVAGRKKIWKLAKIFGWNYVLRLIAGRLSIAQLENAVARFIKRPVKAVMMDAPGLGVDVDKPEDLILARAILEK
jgi:CTP:molybdopterin cytidylyltransferase MocA